MSAIGGRVIELGYEYLESHSFNDSDENWEKAMKVVCEGRDINENAE